MLDVHPDCFSAWGSGHERLDAGQGSQVPEAVESVTDGRLDDRRPEADKIWFRDAYATLAHGLRPLFLTSPLVTLGHPPRAKGSVRSVCYV